VADTDLASQDPYVPACKPDSGKRVAIVGAGPAGLSAAYYLRQEGHHCVVLEKERLAGGRMRREFSADELPPDILEREIDMVFRVGIELNTNSPVTTKRGLDSLLETFDAVLLACGSVDADQAAAWNLKSGRRGLDVDRHSYQTQRPGVFAAGSVIRGPSMVVRSAADGKEAAACISQFLRGQPAQAVGRPFSSRMGRVDTDTMSEFVAGAGSAPRETPSGGHEFDPGHASDQSHRCLACGCMAHGNCRLERYAEMYGADPGRFAGQRQPYEVVDRDCAVLFEPGKCIKCELCVQIAARAREPLGLTFVGRGFDVRLSVPFQGTLDDALQKVADECVAACPTGALDFSHRRAVAGGCGAEGCHAEEDSAEE
jgi:ferredoxin